MSVQYTRTDEIRAEHDTSLIFAVVETF